MEAKKETGNEWLKNFDSSKLRSFAQEVKELGQQLEKEQGPDDVSHLNKIVLWSNLFGVMGFFSMWMGVNLFSVITLSLWTTSRWVMVAHHVCHGGYDKCNPDKGWSRMVFAVGSFWRRLTDWFDWMLPEAWNVEHNHQHHYKLSEVHDPDLVEENTKMLRESSVFLPIKYFSVFLVMTTWKWYYYSPNTYKELKLSELRKKGKSPPEGFEPHDALTFGHILWGQNSPLFSTWEMLSQVLGPYFIVHFFLLPSPYLLLFSALYGDVSVGKEVFWGCVINLFLAELLSNFHSFVIILPNHAGDDLYRFDTSCRPYSDAFYLRQVISSVNYSTGNDYCDFFHGWLNYQIEHHVWPSLSMLSYQKSAPRMKALCEKYGVPYIQENVFARLKKCVDIMVGNTSMKRFPSEYSSLIDDQK